ncbi:PAS domain S-box protein [Vandammella animalimorsus]|uniref:PAS domain S-box protein n=1 Tax=Vandammella animalimorsus TaxID=2029117 RepID=A0A3M6R5N5_9BURK|nr:LuxR C-terminal-related transcriptional regulator [Vandammella animalimorsus]RMX10607.1 PAS domain S-box protein [Vandammella animalimorsus]
MRQNDTILLAFNESPAPQLILRNRVMADCNHAFARLFGYHREELIGEPILRLYPSLADYDLIGRRCLQALQRNVYYEDERFMQHKSGLIFWTRAKGVTLSPAAPFELMIWSFEGILRNATRTTDLTPREREISAQVVNGMSCKQIAAALNISHRTVEAHRARLMKKLGAKNTAELISKIILVQQS